jgi:beta-lactamase regulating signal transducer with metallopeptidase domain
MHTLLEIVVGNAAMAAVLALAAAVLSRLCRRPALTHTLWVLVLLKLVTPPLVFFPLPLLDPAPGEPSPPGPPAAAEAAGPAWAEPGPDLPDLPDEGEGEGVAALWRPDPLPPSPAPPSWRGGAAACWLAGAVLWAAWVFARVGRFRSVLRHARRASGELQTEAESLARRLGLRRCPAVWLVPGAVSPMVWALGQSPCLLFPTGLLGRLGRDGRAALLAHELAHVRRRDHWVRLLELAVTALYWWNPVLWWARRELHEAEEQCCDAWAVWALGGEGRPYALALLEAIAFVSQARLPLPAGASGVGQVSHLKRRLSMVLQGKTSRSLSWAGLGVALGVGLLLLPLFPAHAQQSPAPNPAADARDQDIAALKRAIEILQAEKMREKAKVNPKGADFVRVPAGPAPKTGADVSRVAQDLKAKLQDLEKAMAVKHKELHELEAMASALRAKLQELGAANRDPNWAPKGPGGGSFDPNVKQKLELEKQKLEQWKMIQQRNKTAPDLRFGPAGAPDLEKRLDQLQRELEELRNSLRKGPMTIHTPFLNQPTSPEDLKKLQQLLQLYQAGAAPLSAVTPMDLKKVPPGPNTSPAKK